MRTTIGLPGARCGRPWPCRYPLRRTSLLERPGSMSRTWDVTNFPEVDCDEEFPGSAGNRYFSWGSCRAWKERDLNIAGWHFDERDDNNTLYIQYKSPPTDEAELEALAERILPSALGRGEVDRIEIIPVKYDFGELWRWSVVLDRFASSAGNIVGITGGVVATNATSHGESVWVNDFEIPHWASGLYWPEVRDVVGVWALRPHIAAEALPELLPQLGIPIDAVAFVTRRFSLQQVLRFGEE